MTTHDAPSGAKVPPPGRQDVIAKVRAFALAQELFSPGERVVVGVSGGADSVTLLDVLSELAAFWHLKLIAVYVDHGLRPGTAAEAALVQQLALERGARFALSRVDAATLAEEPGWSTEMAARRLRYQALYREALRAGAEVVAVAHQRDDQAETVLLNLLRGGGRTGLAGMPARGERWLPEGWSAVAAPSPALAVRLVRPLLVLSRAETVSYCRALAVEPVEDPSNDDPRILRNRIRHEILPTLEAIAPGLSRRLSALAPILRAETDFLDEQAELALAEVEAPAGTGAVLSLRRTSFARLHPALQRRVLRLVLAKMGARWPQVRVEQLREVILYGRPTAIDGPQAVRARLQGDMLLFVQPSRAAVSPLAPTGPDATRTPAPTLSIVPGAETIWRARPESAPWRLSLQGLLPRGEVPVAWQGVWLRPECSDGLAVRARRPGDRIQPEGEESPVRLRRLFIAHKVPASERDETPVLLWRGTPVWTPGLPADGRLLARRPGAPAWLLSSARLAAPGSMINS